MPKGFEVDFTVDDLHKLLQKALDRERGIVMPEVGQTDLNDPLSGIKQAIKLRQQSMPRLPGVKQSW